MVGADSFDKVLFSFITISLGGFELAEVSERLLLFVVVWSGRELFLAVSYPLV
jgi:hypothetical protein